jgi:arginine decarboxylase
MFENPQFPTPIIDTLKEISVKPHAAFYTPGHKRGQGISAILKDFLGKKVFTADLPELPELDNLFLPEGAIAKSQNLAAQIFGSQHCYFLINGSSCGLIAGILTTCGEGDKIILPRNVHKSIISGLILSGAMPIFINPDYDPVWDMINSITTEQLEKTLQQHPDAKAVLMVYPTYYGVCGNIEKIAKITHDYHIPLLVDEAHGPHFNFHPDLPRSALSAGADLVVQSTHKVLSSLNQSSMLHIQGNLIDQERLNKCLQIVQTTSPNYLLLASLESASQQMALQGYELMQKTLQLAEEAIAKINNISGLEVLQLKPTASFYDLDKTRLTVRVSGLGLTGYQVDDILHQELQITSELSNKESVTFIISLGNTQTDIDHLIQGFTTLSQRYFLSSSPSPFPVCSPFPSHPLSISPRTAFFANTERVSLSKAIGRISAEIISTYPPGIPLLITGEVITSSALEYLKNAIANGYNITGCSDRSFATISVIIEH